MQRSSLVKLNNNIPDFWLKVWDENIGEEGRRQKTNITTLVWLNGGNPDLRDRRRGLRWLGERRQTLLDLRGRRKGLR